MARLAEQIVRDFCALLERDPGNINAIVNSCTEDVEYVNVPMPPIKGREEMRRFLTPNLTKCSKLDQKIVAIATAADGRTVLTERLDIIYFGDKSIRIPLMGIYVVRDDKIAEWRDYCDITTFKTNMQAIGQLPGPGIGDQSS